MVPRLLRPTTTPNCLPYPVITIAFNFWKWSIVTTKKFDK